MIIKMVCPRCGASMELDEKQETVTCSHCGYQEVYVPEKIEVTHRIDRANEPNLYISYHTSNPAVHMVTRIVSTGQKNTYVDGQEMSFHLPSGEQLVVLKIGKKNYNRKIVIPPDNQPVRISASFSGRANIGIDQPSYTDGGDSTGASAGKGVSGTAAIRKRPSGLSIAAFILSLTFFLSPAAVLLGGADLFLSRKRSDDRHHHGLSVAAVIIGLILSVVLISTRVSSCNRKRERDQEYERIRKEQSEAAETENESLEARMETLRWPRGELGDKIPKPDSERGFVEWENASGFYLYIGGMDERAFRDYADRLYDAGFSVDYSRGETYYRADNADGDHVSIDYKGDGIVSLRADQKREDKTEEPAETETAAETVTEEETETEIPESTEEAAVTEEAAELEGTTEAETAETESSTIAASEETSGESTDRAEDTGSPTGLSQDLVEFLDSYEAFVDEYVEFMKTYDSSDTELLTQYTELLTKLAIFEYNCDKYTESEMSEEDLAYYNEVVLRITQKIQSITP